MMITPFSINSGDAIIHGDIHHAEHRTCPILLIIHGFRGSKNWGFFPTIAEEFALNGSIVISWNMSLSGYSKNAQYIDQPDNFARNTITQEIRDTQSIIDSILHDDHILSNDLRSAWNGDIHVLLLSGIQFQDLADSPRDKRNSGLKAVHFQSMKPKTG